MPSACLCVPSAGTPQWILRMLELARFQIRHIPLFLLLFSVSFFPLRLGSICWLVLCCARQIWGLSEWSKEHGVDLIVVLARLLWWLPKARHAMRRCSIDQVQARSKDGIPFGSSPGERC